MKQKEKNGEKQSKFKFPALNLLSSFEILSYNSINCRRKVFSTNSSTQDGSVINEEAAVFEDKHDLPYSDLSKTYDFVHRSTTSCPAPMSNLPSRGCCGRDNLAMERSPRSTCHSTATSCTAIRLKHSCSIENFLRLRSLSDELSMEMEKHSYQSIRSCGSGKTTEHSFLSLATSLQSLENRLWKICKSPYRSAHDSDMYDKLDSRKGSKHLSSDYHVNTQTLLEGYVEKKVRFAGVVPDVQIDDLTNRTDVLRIIDDGKKQGIVHYHTTEKEHGASFTLNVHNIKLMLHRELLLRISMHEIAAVCYIKDDNDNILSIKYGVPDKCNLAVLYVDNRIQAEEICALVDQCFQLVYRETAIQFIDRKLTHAFTTSVTSSNTQSEPQDNNTLNNQGDNPLKLSYITTSDPNLTKNSSSSCTCTSPKRSNRAISITADSEIGLAGCFEVLQDYLKKLPKCLTVKELRQFAMLLKAWHNEPGTTTSEFCEKVFKLYGQERKHMLAGMGPFIPAEEYHVFEEFLAKNSVSLPANGHGTISSYRSYTPQRSNSVSDIGVTTHSMNGADSDEFDRMIDCFSNQIDLMENSVEVDSFMS